MSIMYTLLKHSNFTNSLDNCRAARVSEANDRVLFEICIHIIIYMFTLYTSRCYNCANLMSAHCAEWLCSCAACSSVVSSALWRFFCRRSAASRSDFDVGGAIPPPLCCALVQCPVASCSAPISSADSHSDLSISTNAGSHSAGARNSRLRTICHYHC